MGLGFDSEDIRDSQPKEKKMEKENRDDLFFPRSFYSLDILISFPIGMIKAV